MIANKQTQKVFRIDNNLGITMRRIRGGRAGPGALSARRSVALSTSTERTALGRRRRNAPRQHPQWESNVPLSRLDDRRGDRRQGRSCVFGGPGGGSIEDRYVSVGSGSTFAYGVLEEAYSRDISVSDGVDLAIRGLTVAMKRDSASGDGYLINTITAKEYKEFSEDEINKRLKALKIPLPPVLP